MSTDIILFWNRNNARPIWTDDDWRNYDQAYTGYLKQIATNAVNRFLQNVNKR